MSVVRRFLVASSLARLIRRDRGNSRITEGYFAPQGGRTSLVRIDGQHCQLVLVNVGSDGVASEERTDVPRAHGDALLDVCGGKAVYERSSLTLSPGRDVLIDRYVTPAGLDLLSVAFDDDAGAKAFKLPSWFGTEVSSDAAYERHAIALQGIPEPAKLAITNAMLDAVLDLLEPRFGIGRFGAPGKPGEDESAANAARRAAGNGAPVPGQPAPAPKPAVVPPSAPAAAAAAPKPPAPPVARPVPQPAAAAAPKPAPAAEPQAARIEPAPAIVTTAAAPVPVAAKAPPSPNEAGADAPPVPAETKPEPAAAAAEPAQEPKGDARIDDVIESLSQALGAAIQQPREPAADGDLAAEFERWTVRPRRTQQ